MALEKHFIWTESCCFFTSHLFSTNYLLSHVTGSLQQGWGLHLWICMGAAISIELYLGLLLKCSSMALLTKPLIWASSGAALECWYHVFGLATHGQWINIFRNRIRWPYFQVPTKAFSWSIFIFQERMGKMMLFYESVKATIKAKKSIQNKIKWDLLTKIFHKKKKPGWCLISLGTSYELLEHRLVPGTLYVILLSPDKSPGRGDFKTHLSKKGN